ncbi:cation:proton antiporter domain-containing protein [Thalassovita aquimarina]|uniref:cation:proton antiporter domain-containing protein n=1 Tax=Thalassovita aquimarina TaxID=2785917 RepID=UPI0035616BF1
MQQRLTPNFLVLLSRICLAAIFFASLPRLAFAAGGAVPSLVQDIGTSLLVAGGLAILFVRLKIPSIAGFLVAGVLLGPQGLHLITDPSNIEAIAQIGFVLLLFMIGLEIDVRSMLSGNRAVLAASAIQYPLTLLFGFVIAKGLILAGIGGVLGDMPLAPLYIGIAVAGSSSLLVVKLFQEHFQLDTQPGRICLMVLIFQDIWAIVATLVQPSLEQPELSAILFSFLGIGVLILIAAGLAKLVVNRAFGWIAKVPEMILLGAMSWCFAMVAIGTHLDPATELLGFNLHLNVGSGMAALIAGATIASSPFSTEIVTKVGLVKDFFITLFFVGLGITMPALAGIEVPLLALAVAAIALLARQFVVFPLLYLFRVDQRCAQVSAIRLAQISEFALVITFLGLELGHINHEIASVIILAFVITAVLTTPLFERAYDIYEAMKGTLTRLGFKEPADGGGDEAEEIELAVLGIHRDASSFLVELARAHPEIMPKTVVVDFNVSVHPRTRELGVKVKYGDIANEEALIHAGVDRAKVILCTISDDLLRGISNLELVKVLRRLNPTATIISNAIEMKSIAELRAAGADIVYMSRLEVAHALLDVFAKARDGRIDAVTEDQQTRFGDIEARSEIMR